MSKSIPLAVGMIGIFYGNGHGAGRRAEITHIWSETCVTLALLEGKDPFKPTSVFVPPLGTPADRLPAGYYFLPDAFVEAAKHQIVTIEGAIIESGADKAPRVTPADIEANIVSEHYFTAADGVAGAGPVIAAEFWHRENGHAIVDYSEHTHVGHLSAEKGYDCLPLVHKAKPGTPLGLLTFCVLVLKNGFAVTGESACASPENFNADIGRRIARENAVNKIWPLMGYELRTKLATD